VAKLRFQFGNLRPESRMHHVRRIAIQQSRNVDHPKCWVAKDHAIAMIYRRWNAIDQLSPK